MPPLPLTERRYRMPGMARISADRLKADAGDKPYDENQDKNHRHPLRPTSHIHLTLNIQDAVRSMHKG